MVEAAPSVSAAARLVGAVRCDYYASQQGSLAEMAITAITRSPAHISM
jgi:hypothetical protein